MIIEAQTTAIFKALDDFRYFEGHQLPTKKTYYGKAYKDGEPGVIAFWLIKHYTNSLMMPDITNYFLIYRHTFWNGWREQCNYQGPGRNGHAYMFGVTINREIFDDLARSRYQEKTEFIIIHVGQVYRFESKTLVDFVIKNKTYATNQNHGFEEVGVPIALASSITNLR